MRCGRTGNGWRRTTRRRSPDTRAPGALPRAGGALRGSRVLCPALAHVLQLDWLLDPSLNEPDVQLVPLPLPLPLPDVSTLRPLSLPLLESVPLSEEWPEYDNHEPLPDDDPDPVLDEQVLHDSCESVLLKLPPRLGRRRRVLRAGSTATVDESGRAPCALVACAPVLTLSVSAGLVCVGRADTRVWSSCTRRRLVPVRCSCEPACNRASPRARTTPRSRATLWLALIEASAVREG